MKKFRKKIKNMLNPTFVKFICICLATGIFFYVRFDQEQTREYIVDVDVINVPAKLAILERDNLQTTVSIRVFKDQYLKLPENILAHIDLTNAKKGSNSYNIILNDKDIKANRSLRVSMLPIDINVTLDNIAYKTVNITPIITGSPIAGASIQGIEFEPRSVNISGAREIISKIDTIKTLNIDITGESNTYKIYRSLSIPKYVNSDSTRTQLEIKFTQNTIRKEYNDLDININNLNNRFNVETKEGVTITKLILEGDQSAMETLANNGLKVSINLEDITESGEYTNKTVSLNIPPQIKIIEIEPANFTVIVKDKNKVKDKDKEVVKDKNKVIIKDKEEL